MSEANFKKLIENAQDAKTKKALKEIMKEDMEVRERGKIIEGDGIVELRMFGYRFFMAKKCANSSIHTLSGIFLDEQHQRMPGFNGKDAGIVVDVGANEGFYSMKMKNNNPDLNVYAFEPNPMAYRMLERNVAENGLEGVNISDVALSDINEDESFQLVDEITAIGGFRIFGYRPWLDANRIKDIMVRSATIDKTLSDVDLIDILKIDVEGAECRVLRGAEDTLPKIDKIVVECHGDDMRAKVKKYLGKRGYTLVFEDESVCGDLYFVR